MSGMVVMEQSSEIFRPIIGSLRKKKMPHAYAPAPPINAHATEANEYIH